MNAESSELKLHFLDYWRVIRIRFPLVLLIFLLVAGTASVLTYLMPRKYLSTVTMQVKSDTRLNLFGQGGERSDPRFVTTQFEIIQRKEILYPVIEVLGLEQRWKLGTRELTYLKLRGQIQVREVRNTELIQISALNVDRNEAAEIANAVAEEYRRARISEQKEVESRSLAQLREEVDKQSTKVDELRYAKDRIRIEAKINDLSPESVEDPVQAQEKVLMSAEDTVGGERLRVAAVRARYEQIAQMTDDQIMRSISALQIEDPTILQVLPLYQQAASEEASMLNSGLGPNHPLVKSLRAKKDVMRAQLDEQIKVLRKTLFSNLQISEGQMKELEGGLTDARDRQQDSKSRAASYYEAKNNYIQAKRLLEAAEMRLSTERMQRSMPQTPVTIWEKAEASSFPARPRVGLNIALGVLVGLVFGVGMAFFIEYLDTSVKTLEDVESYLKVAVLAVIPKKVGVLARLAGDHRDAEAYRILRTNIEFNRKSPDANTIAVVSGGPGEGKSTTVANIAYTFAKGGYTTLLVDADLRRPTQHQLFGIADDRGLSDALMKGAPVETVIQATSTDNLYILPSGRLPADSVGVLNSQAMIEFVEDVKGRFDIVFFDSPPILGVSDASVLTAIMDATIIVVQHRRFPRNMLMRVKNTVISSGGSILGVVLNNVDVRHDQHYEYYTSYYGYYQKSEKPVVPGKRGKTPAGTGQEAY